MTKKEKTKKLILIIFLMIICSALIYSYTKNQPKQDNIPPVTLPANSTKTLGTTSTATNATLLVNETSYGTKIAGPMNVYDFMIQLQNEGKITFQTKNYSGMGEFVEEINGVKNGNKNWIYYVNEKKAEIGISNYKINPGDVVSWKYE